MSTPENHSKPGAAVTYTAPESPMTADLTREQIENLRTVWIGEANERSEKFPDSVVAEVCRQANALCDMAMRSLEAPSAIETIPASLFTKWGNCKDCGAAILSQHPKADPAVIAGQRVVEAYKAAPPEERDNLKAEHARMRKALDDIYNDSDEARAIVVKHYGIWHGSDSRKIGGQS